MTYLTGTLSLVWDVLYDGNCHNIHFGNQFSSLPHDRLFHRSYFSRFQYLIKSWTSLRMSQRAENTHSILTLQLRLTLDSQSDKTRLLTTDGVCALIRAIEKDKSSCLN